MKPLHDLIAQQVESYTSKKVTRTDTSELSMYDTLQLIEHICDSTFQSGKTDSRGQPKPFFNITNGKLKIAIRATDIDRKDINIKCDGSEYVYKSFVASKFNHQLMKKMKLQEYLNSWGERLPKYGSVLTKIVERKGELNISVCDWHNIVCDPVNVDSAPIIEKLTYSPAELMIEADAQGWDKKQCKELIESARTPRKDLKGKVVYEDAEHITVWEVHGILPDYYMKDKPTDDDQYSYTRQMHVIARVYQRDPNTRKREVRDFVLFQGKEKKNPYSKSDWQTRDGFTLGLGVVEEMFEPQIWTNYDKKRMKDQLDIASTTVYQTADSNITARNTLSDLTNGDFIIHAPNMPIEAVNVQPQGLEGLKVSMDQWNQQSKDMISMPDAISGNTMPSGTAFRQVAMLNTEAHSYFDYITENKGNYLEFLYREYIIPYIIKQLDNKDEIVAVLSQYEIEWLDGEFAENEATQHIVNNTIQQNVVSPIQVDALKQQKLMDLKKTGAKRYLHNDGKSWSQYFKDFKWEADINITGEQQDKKALMDTLFNALQLVASNPAVLQNPVSKMLFMKLVEASDFVSPYELETSMSQSQPASTQGQPAQPGQPGQGNLQGAFPQPPASNQGGSVTANE